MKIIFYVFINYNNEPSHNLFHQDEKMSQIIRLLNHPQEIKQKKSKKGEKNLPYKKKVVSLQQKWFG
jgi:hypothetical protein